jgi:hypothetical protein
MENKHEYQLRTSIPYSSGNWNTVKSVLEETALANEDGYKTDIDKPHLFRFIAAGPFGFDATMALYAMSENAIITLTCTGDTLTLEKIAQAINRA